MEPTDLYATYGKLLIEAEIIQSKINSVKQQIAASLNHLPPTIPNPPDEDTVE